jgi:hypothetical protein
VNSRQGRVEARRIQTITLRQLSPGPHSARKPSWVADQRGDPAALRLERAQETPADIAGGAREENFSTTIHAPTLTAEPRVFWQRKRRKHSARAERAAKDRALSLAAFDLLL